jgi:predicted nucleotidyltransferase
MKFSENYEKIMGSKPKLQVLKHVLSTGFEMSGRELARITDLSHMTINRILKYFYSINLVKMRRYGRTYAWTANEESYLYKKLKTVITGMKEIDPLPDLKNFLLKKTQMPGIIRAYIFGSVGKAKEAADSDIDYFVIVKDARVKHELEEKLAQAGLECIRVFGNSLSPYILTVNEYEEKKDKLAVIKNAEKGIRVV